jgi:ATP-binding cassette, subfamily B, multidrug efflux pump
MKPRLNRALPGMLFFQFLEFWPYYIGAFICLFGTHWIQSQLPFMAKELADLVSRGSEHIETAYFFWLALGIIVFRTSSRLLFFYPARVLEKNLRVELLSRLEETPPSRYSSYSPGQLFQIMQVDMEQVRALVGFALLQVGNIAIAMAVLIPKLASFHQGLLQALLPLVGAFILFTLIVGRNQKLFRFIQDRQGDVQNLLIESYMGKKTIKNFHAEDSMIDLFKQYSWKELILFYRAGLGIGISIPILPLGIGLSLLWGGHIVYQEQLGPSALVLFSGFIFLFLEPIMFLSWIGIVFARSYGSWQRIRELVLSILDKSEHEVLLEKYNPQFNVEEENCLFLDFWGEKLCFPFKKSRWTVIIGKTGHGKTHLLEQIGDVFKLKGLEISSVSQSPYLYNDSLINNIFLGKEATSEELDEAHELLILFGLDILNSERDGLFSLEVGENGKQLSGGQVKRLCLIRSLMSQSEVILWDDPFSSVDLIQEKAIIQKLRAFDRVNQKTILLTSHRMTTVRASDEVIFIDKERAKENGIVTRGPVSEELQPEREVYEYFEKQMV